MFSTYKRPRRRTTTQFLSRVLADFKLLRIFMSNLVARGRALGGGGRVVNRSAPFPATHQAAPPLWQYPQYRSGFRTGDRSALSYLVKPMSDYFTRAFREG